MNYIKLANIAFPMDNFMLQFYVQGRYINDDRDTGIVRREITDRDTGKQMMTGILGHREYK